MSTLGLGTVQFGMPYGISNSAGMVPPDEAGRMLALAARSGIRVLDTAPAYAKSEEVLGAQLGGQSFQIVSKTLKGEVAATFERSLERLGQKSLYGLIVHDGDALGGDGGAALWAEMAKLKAAGKVQKIGTSVYTGAQIDAVLAKFPIDLIQLPINVLDQRLLRSGHLDRLKEKGVEVHARSVFLQGLLLMDPAQPGPHFDGVRGHLRKLHAAPGGSMLEKALGFVQALPQIDVVLTGATSARELEEIVAASRSAKPIAGDWAWDDEAVLNPARWPKA